MGQLMGVCKEEHSVVALFQNHNREDQARGKAEQEEALRSSITRSTVLTAITDLETDP